MHKITFKDGRQFNGVYMSVRFQGGQAETESAYLAKRFEAKGLAVEAVDAPPAGAEESFACPVCEKTYKLQAYLDAHLAKKHPEYKPSEE